MKRIVITESEVIYNVDGFSTRFDIAEDNSLQSKVNTLESHIEGNLSEDEVSKKNDAKTNRKNQLDAQITELQSQRSSLD